MKFEIHRVSIGSPGDFPTLPGRAHLALERGPFAGRSFTVVFRICSNPCCPCAVVGFGCRSEAGPDRLISFDLDVAERQVTVMAGSTREEVGLGRAFVAEAETSHWEWLTRFFLATKRRQMETMNLDTLDVELPPDVQAGDGTVVGYNEVFPWAERCTFTHASVTWLVDDQHCIMPDCTCTQSCLMFFRVPTDNPLRPKRLRPAASFWYDYRNGQSNILEARRGNPSPEMLLQALRAAQPDLERQLERRHLQLKQLGRRLMPEAAHRSPDHLAARSVAAIEIPTAAGPLPPPPPPMVRAAPRPGRNDPCPCGSGKKFKKCCGAA